MVQPTHATNPISALSINADGESERAFDEGNEIEQCANYRPTSDAIYENKRTKRRKINLLTGEIAALIVDSALRRSDRHRQPKSMKPHATNTNNRCSRGPSFCGRSIQTAPRRNIQTHLRSKAENGKRMQRCEMHSTQLHCCAFESEIGAPKPNDSRWSRAHKWLWMRPVDKSSGDDSEPRFSIYEGPAIIHADIRGVGNSRHRHFNSSYSRTILARWMIPLFNTFNYCARLSIHSNPKRSAA